MNIDQCTTWECINSFANWLSAAGTFVISGLALWLSVKDRLINLKASLATGLVPGRDPMVINQAVFILEYVKLGPRPVTITNHSWKLPFSRRRIVLLPHLDPSVGHFCSKFPIELSDGKSGMTFYPIDFFSTLVDNPESLFFPKSKLAAWIRIHFFSLVVSTSIGKQVKVNVRPAVRKRLWRQYSES